MFLTDRKQGKALYSVEFELLKRPASELRVHVTFENPSESGDPLLEEVSLKPDQPSLVVQSTLLPCIENNRTYMVRVQAFDAKGNAVAQHQQEVRMEVPEAYFTQLGLRECEAPY